MDCVAMIKLIITMNTLGGGWLAGWLDGGLVFVVVAPDWKL